MTKGGTTYILTNINHTVLYIGVTSDINGRMFDHATKAYPSSFTARYNCTHLVYFENFHSIEEAIHREKQLKGWNRKWKEDLIDKFNPLWINMFNPISNEVNWP